MTLIVDANTLFIQADGDDPRHEDVARVLRAEQGLLVTSEAVVAEADYLIMRLGIDVELAFLEDLAEGTFVVDCLDRDELGLAMQVVRRYRDLKLGLADASLVVLAHKYGTRRVLTFDERAFRAVTPLQGGAFMILPADG